MSNESEPPPAPGALRWVEELVNTRSVELGTDELATPGQAAAWLHDRGLVPAGTSVTPAPHRRLLQVREGLRAMIVANNDDHQAANRPHRGDDTDLDVDHTPDLDLLAARATLAALARDLPLVLDVTAQPPQLAPRASGTVDDALAALLAAVAIAVADGSWHRLKACREPRCRWAYFDHSRNRSRAWCSMALCGNRAKARAFRQRSTPTRSRRAR